MSAAQEHQALADQMVQSAVAFCARRVFGGDAGRAAQALRQGRCDVCDYLRYGLARQIADYLGRMDHHVKSVYVFDSEPAPIDDGAGCADARSSGISLICRVNRKTAALAALASALEAHLSASRRAIGCANAAPACYFLDVHMVDDADVRDQRGYAALLGGLHTRPIQVWLRAGN
jgi:hypothetical protein